MSLRPPATRRDLLALGAATAAMAASPVWAAESATSSIYRRAIVIDGNLSLGEITDTQPLSASDAASVRASGLTAMKWSLGGTGMDGQTTEKELADLRQAIARNSHVCFQIEHAAQIDEAKQSAMAGIIFSFETASMHDGRLVSIDHFAGEGVRVMGLSYNLGSPFGAGTLQGADKGLTPRGRQAVARMDALGVTVDISHSNETTGFQATSAARGPLLITHAGSAAIHPHPRNKSDKLMRAVADRGGAIGIFDLSYLGNYPNYPTLDIYMRHLTHALDVCGEDHVGIGSDSDLLAIDTSPAAVADGEKNEARRRAEGVAAPEELAFPIVVGLNGPDRWQVICRELLRRGYSERAAEKVLGANFARVFTETWSART